jgi:hypothetical protein
VASTFLISAIACAIKGMNAEDEKACRPMDFVTTEGMELVPVSNKIPCNGTSKAHHSCTWQALLGKGDGGIQAKPNIFWKCLKKEKHVLGCACP